MSKDLAHRIAVKLCEKKQKNVSLLHNELSKYVTAAWMQTIPKEVISMQKKHPEYFSTMSRVVFDGDGFRWESIPTIHSVIANTKSNNPVMPRNEKVYAEAKKLHEKHSAAKKEIEELMMQIETALNGLKSFTQIQKHLPEAVPFLPKSTSVELMVNFDDLRTKIAS